MSSSKPPKPPPEDREEMLRRAYAGATPLANRGRIASAKQARVVPPRSRSAAKPAFHTARDEDGRMQGHRVNTHARVLTALKSERASPPTLDLHGMRVEEAREAIVRFVRSHSQRGCTTVLVVHGKGSHSHDGRGVLAECAVTTLTEGPAAFFVTAYCSAPARLGGTGALLVALHRLSGSRLSRPR